MNDPRSILLNNIQNKSGLPQQLINCISTNKGTIVDSNNNNKNNNIIKNNEELIDNNNDNKIVLKKLQETMNSPHINYFENERIANAILNNEELKISDPNNTIHRHHKNMKNKSYNILRHTTRHNFLEVISDNIPVQEMNVIEELKKQKNSRDIRSQGYVWAGEFIETSPELYNIQHESNIKQKKEEKMRVNAITQAQSDSKKFTIINIVTIIYYIL